MRPRRRWRHSSRRSARAGCGSPSPRAGGSGGSDSGVAAYSSLLTDTFSGNHDLDARAAALHQDGVDAAAVMVRRLNAIADEEGLSFRIGGVSASDVTDITWEPASLEDLFLRHYAAVPSGRPRPAARQVQPRLGLLARVT